MRYYMQELASNRSIVLLNTLEELEIRNEFRRLLHKVSLVLEDKRTRCEFR